MSEILQSTDDVVYRVGYLIPEAEGNVQILRKVHNGVDKGYMSYNTEEHAQEEIDNLLLHDSQGEYFVVKHIIKTKMIRV